MFVKLHRGAVKELRYMLVCIPCSIEPLTAEQIRDEEVSGYRLEYLGGAGDRFGWFLNGARRS